MQQKVEVGMSSLENQGPHGVKAESVLVQQGGWSQSVQPQPTRDPATGASRNHVRRERAKERRRQGEERRREEKRREKKEETSEERTEEREEC